MAICHYLSKLRHGTTGQHCLIVFGIGYGSIIHDACSSLSRAPDGIAGCQLNPCSMLDIEEAAGSVGRHR
jgi:hypothetical protein